ncbi:MAG: hemin receptor [Prevotella sp.]|nr:hemin receptor [Prevotella sp.]
MKKIISISLLSLVALSLSAQETYQNAIIAKEDLNGTARYVGMGGAMDALGADISTIGTNPAGIGVFRHSTVNLSAGLISQQSAHSFAGKDPTKLSFDQAGFVFSQPTGKNSYVNFAFNYHKSTNFAYILAASDALSGASQNKLSYMKGAEGVFNITSNGMHYTSNSNAFSQVDYLYYNGLLADEGDFYYTDADKYAINRADRGYIGEYDFNISGNVNNRLYWGVTFGICDVNYRSYSEYNETLGSDGRAVLSDERKIDGTGFNIKMGLIFRPIESSPFRIGISVATPTFYDLTTTNRTSLRLEDWTANYGSPQTSISEAYDFKVYTPWKFGVSLGTTFGKHVAIGAVYEYADYAHLDTRVNTGGGYDWYYDTYYDTSSSDRAMNHHTKETLRGVSTFKLGAEVKIFDNLAVRVGYNYESPMYRKSGYKDGTINSPGTYYASETDYTNWSGSNRFTCGVGYNISNFSIDLAYQYCAQNGDYSPFMNYYASDASSSDNNICNSIKVDNDRHQLLLTLGYHF